MKKSCKENLVQCESYLWNGGNRREGTIRFLSESAKREDIGDELIIAYMEDEDADFAWMMATPLDRATMYMAAKMAKKEVKK